MNIVRGMVRRRFVISQCLKGSNAILRYNPLAEPRSGTTRYRADSGSQAQQERDLKAMITRPDQSCRRPAPCPGTLSGFRRLNGLVRKPKAPAFRTRARISSSGKAVTKMIGVAARRQSADPANLHRSCRASVYRRLNKPCPRHDSSAEIPRRTRMFPQHTPSIERAPW